MTVVHVHPLHSQLLPMENSTTGSYITVKAKNPFSAAVASVQVQIGG